MKLTIFDKNNSEMTSARTGVRSAYINRKTGTISFSNSLKKGLRITVEQTVYFAKDEDSKTGDWYICFNAGENGLALKEKKNSGYAKDCERTIYFSNKFIANKILDASKAQQSASFLVSEKPVMIDGKEWYKIVLSKPLRVN